MYRYYWCHPGTFEPDCSVTADLGARLESSEGTVDFARSGVAVADWRLRASQTRQGLTWTRSDRRTRLKKRRTSNVKAVRKRCTAADGSLFEKELRGPWLWV